MTRSAAIWIVVAIFLGGCQSARGDLYAQLLESDAIAEKLNKHGGSIVFNSLYPSVNSAGGVDINLSFFNTSDETIKYLHATFKAYNAVGDVQIGDIHRSSTGKIKVTGPIKPVEREQGTYGVLWYNSTITCVRVTRLTITYISGRQKSFDSNSVKALFSSGSFHEKAGNSCSMTAQESGSS